MYKDISLNLLIDGKPTVIPARMSYGIEYDDSIISINFEIDTPDLHIVSERHNNMEVAVINLQRALPKNISIACCESCKHGNLCPYGNNDNYIFCLKDTLPNSESDVCNFFENNINIEPFKRKLLDCCEHYKSLTKDDYAYKDWFYWQDRPLKSELKDGYFRVIKIGKEALFEFIYESIIDHQKDFFDIPDATEITSHFNMDFESGEFICLIRNDSQLHLPGEIDMDRLLKMLPETTKTLYAPNRYIELTIDEIKKIQSDG